ncbi:flagellar assembly protein FliW [Helicobacter macacae]|uniref:Flagellar assembly factor FliW n=1 Tax=Helicobacter macacae MIT 99-5501 TaxID=1357400 RepID=V8CBQ6_9HELI|nr:flagellar assembly protein FliW [Helicobacter macacae]ETD24804.1 hypothetical protein HMPREF2086_00138 [Helicobacter macacae MIT 99-5501]
MRYAIKAPILGFEYISSVEIVKIDEYFSKIIAQSDDTSREVAHNIEMMLVNPYTLREYSFIIPKYIESLLEIDSTSRLEVYCIVVLQRNVEDSMVNFLAPLVFNTANKTAGQIALSMIEYPDFGFKESLKSFMRQGA